MASGGECTAVSLDLFLTSPNLIVGACRFMTEENVNSSDAHYKNLKKTSPIRNTMFYEIFGRNYDNITITMDIFLLQIRS